MLELSKVNFTDPLIVSAILMSYTGVSKKIKKIGSFAPQEA